MSRKLIILKIVVSLYVLVMAGHVFIMFVGAGVGYGYYGYKDKSSAEMTAIITEFLFDLVLFIAFLLMTGLVWRRTLIGRWSYFVMAGPLLTAIWWDIQCPCVPSGLYELADFLLPLTGMGLIRIYRFWFLPFAGADTR